MIKHFLNDSETISVIGMAKNVGKTTIVNQLIEELFNNTRIGLTTIGVDGENIDIVTNTHKPSVYVPSNTVIATARSTLSNSDVTYKILEVLDFDTPLGNIVIICTLSDGYVKIAGPSYNEQLKVVIERLYKYGAQKVIVDGAAGRKQLAHSSVADSFILATGASYNSKIKKVVDDTTFLIDLLQMEKLCDTRVIECAKKIISECKVGLINKEFETEKLDSISALGSKDDIFMNINQNTTHIVINGAITDSLLNSFVEKKSLTEHITIVTVNPVNVIASSEVLNRVMRANIKIKTIEKAKILFVGVNPTSPYGYQFDKDQFITLMEENIELPIVDVIGGY